MLRVPFLFFLDHVVYAFSKSIACKALARLRVTCAGQVCGGHISGMFGFFFCKGPVTCFADATKSDTEKFGKWHRMMLQKAGVSIETDKVGAICARRGASCRRLG